MINHSNTTKELNMSKGKVVLAVLVAVFVFTYVVLPVVEFLSRI
jgi:hypothetical protein